MKNQILQQNDETSCCGVRFRRFVSSFCCECSQLFHAAGRNARHFVHATDRTARHFVVHATGRNARQFVLKHFTSENMAECSPICFIRSLGANNAYYIRQYSIFYGFRPGLSIENLLTLTTLPHNSPHNNVHLMLVID